MGKKSLYARLTKTGKWVVWIGTTLMLFLVILLVTMGIFSALTREKDPGTIQYKYGVGSRRDRTQTVDRRLYCPDGIACFNFSRLAEDCSFSVSGDETRLRFLFNAADGGVDSVTFFPGSARIDVNGTFVLLEAPVRKQGNTLYVPCDFITRCMNGVTAKITPDKITVVYDRATVSLRPDMRPLPPIDISESDS